jgi:hypothetical protein
MDEAAGIVGGRVIRLQLDGFAEVCDCTIEIALELVGRTAVIVGDRVIGLGLQRTRACLYSGVFSIRFETALLVIDRCYRRCSDHRCHDQQHPAHCVLPLHPPRVIARTGLRRIGDHRRKVPALHGLREPD